MTHHQSFGTTNRVLHHGCIRGSHLGWYGSSSSTKCRQNSKRGLTTRGDTGSVTCTTAAVTRHGCRVKRGEKFPMADPVKAPSGISQKIGPLPLWAWVAVGAAALGIVFIIRNQQQNAGTPTTVGSSIPDTTGGQGFQDPMNITDLTLAMQALTQAINNENQIQNQQPPPVRGGDPSGPPEWLPGTMPTGTQLPPNVVPWGGQNGWVPQSPSQSPPLPNGLRTPRGATNPADSGVPQLNEAARVHTQRLAVSTSRTHGGLSTARLSSTPSGWPLKRFNFRAISRPINTVRVPR